MAEQSLRSMVETWSRDEVALRELLDSPTATARRFGLTEIEFGALQGADRLRPGDKGVERGAAPSTPIQRTEILTITGPGPSTQTTSPLTITAGPSTQTTSPLTITAGPSTQTTSPLTITAGPSTQTLMPITITAGPSTQTTMPITITAGPSTQTLMPLTITAGPSTQTLMPLTITGPGDPPMTFETGSTISGDGGAGSGDGPREDPWPTTFETGSTITGDSSLTFETSSTVSGGAREGDR